MSDAQGSLILLYHRVTSVDRDPQLLCVSPEHFEQHLQVLQRRSRVLPLGTLVEGIHSHSVPRGCIAITFDDGYADNAIEAAPILRRHGVPATIFATTAHTNSRLEFFWDDLDRILLAPGKLPERLRLWGPDGILEMSLDDCASYPREQAHSHRYWTVLAKEDPTPRHRAYRLLSQALHRCTVARRREILDQLQLWSGAMRRDSHRMMSADEIRNLPTGGLIEIGGHTIDHPLLSIEEEDSQFRQIRDNRATLQWIVQRPPAGFSYPFGTRHDFTPSTVTLVEQTGFQYACANFPGHVTRASDPFRLPRFVVRDWDAREFERHLDKWLVAPAPTSHPLPDAA